MAVRGRGLAAAGIIGDMRVVKINAITVPADSGDELAQRFAKRAGAVDNEDGFEGFELLKPTDERTTWLVVTRWRDEASFQAWVHSPAFSHGHRSAAERSGGEAPPGGRGQQRAVVLRDCGRLRRPRLGVWLMPDRPGRINKGGRPPDERWPPALGFPPAQ